MSKIIKGPWKPRDYDPSKDPEFRLETQASNWIYLAITVGSIILAIVFIYNF